MEPPIPPPNAECMTLAPTHAWYQHRHHLFRGLVSHEETQSADGLGACTLTPSALVRPVAALARAHGHREGANLTACATACQSRDDRLAGREGRAQRTTSHSERAVLVRGGMRRRRVSPTARTTIDAIIAATTPRAELPKAVHAPATTKPATTNATTKTISIVRSRFCVLFVF